MNAVRTEALMPYCGEESAPTPMDAQELYERLCEGDPIWLADAVQHAVCNNDLAYLIRQVERHVPGWVRT